MFGSNGSNKMFALCSMVVNFGYLHFVVVQMPNVCNPSHHVPKALLFSFN